MKDTEVVKTISVKVATGKIIKAERERCLGVVALARDGGIPGTWVAIISAITSGKSIEELKRDKA